MEDEGTYKTRIFITHFEEHKCSLCTRFGFRKPAAYNKKCTPCRDTYPTPLPSTPVGVSILQLGNITPLWRCMTNAGVVGRQAFFKT